MSLFCNVKCVFLTCPVCRNELLGLEGMVKLTNPDDAIINNANTVVTVEQKLLSNENESKRFMYCFFYVLLYYNNLLDLAVTLKFVFIIFYIKF